MKFQISLLLFIFLLLSSCNSNTDTAIEPNIIPKPVSQQLTEGIFMLSNQTSLEPIAEFKNVVSFLDTYLYEKYRLQLVTSIAKNSIAFVFDNSIKNDEGYTLNVSKKKIEIKAKTEAGAFYAVQSLLQLLPVKTDKKEIAIQCLEIEDAPRFSYRGMHLDVARHFYSVDFIKKYIDLMAMLKLNSFHWHLTDDQGWRIEIKKYPKLQEVAAFREETLVGHYSDQPHKFDGEKYGGYYTQEEIKEIVAYASERQITVIPEIEMPGHSQAAIAAYPELGCSNSKDIKVATKWGVFEEIYCPKENTFNFLENVIDEVVTLFPSKYIHIGGDEAPKTRWKNCKHCQELIKKEGLKDEHGLQSYFIKRMEKYINQKGKQIIGWDEILEGGLAPNATVMSWRGTKGAVEAAKENHDVILTPTSHCYFDYYQSDNEDEPLAIGGFLPLEKVFNFEPIPKELSVEESQYVLGAQGNVWTEYMKTPEKVEYMAFPRMLALAEVVWSQKEAKNYTDFVKRLEYFNERLDVFDVNYANHIYEVKGQLRNTDGELNYELKTTTDKKIVYSLDGNEPVMLLYPEYTKPIKIDSSTIIKAAVFDFESEKQLGSTFMQRINLHKAVGAKISLNVEPHPSYNAGGKGALINGIAGNDKRFGDKEWLGFWGDDVEITIDLGERKKIEKINLRFFESQGQWIYEPNEVYIYAYNDTKIDLGDKNLFEPDLFDMSVLLLRPKVKENVLKEYEYQHTKDIYRGDFISDEKVRYIKIWVKNYGKIPEGKQGAGNKAWTFIDEIIVE